MTDSGASIRVRVPGRAEEDYAVTVESGALGRLGELCVEAAPAHVYAVIADSRVAELYGQTAVTSLGEAGAEAVLAPFPAGEWNKTREEWARLSDRLLHDGVGRDAAVVALGGGVTGDLAGFVAASYMRGLPVIQVPTSLLAMVDSAVGGKVGVDTPAGKNLVGAFHHPRLVVVDPELLRTLPPHQRWAGLAEVVKTAVIRDPDFFEWLQVAAEDLRRGEEEALEEAVVRSVRHKAEVVAADPAEAGLRETLNFGHTVAHALELLAGYELLHGEAVAAGMRAEARLGERLGVTEQGTTARIVDLLDACGLRGRPEEERRAPAVWRAARHDKKARAGRVRCVLLRRIGQVEPAEEGGWAHTIPPELGEDWFRAALSDGGPDPVFPRASEG